VFVRALVPGDGAAPAWLDAVAGGEIRAIAPDLVFYEVANALAEYVHTNELTEIEAAESVDDMLDLRLEIHSARTLAAQAHALAVARGISAYDAAYLALSLGYDATLVTADRRLAGEAERSALLPDEGPPG
jgi:predicted nucleic acid-binding protein